MDDPIFKLEKVVQTRGDEPLEDFEGPLDLILYLLGKNKIEIQDIPIALILEQYQDYLEKRKRMDLEVASEFITMAAQLMFIKTRMLLNLEDEEAQSEMDALIKSLEERQRGDIYARIKVLSERLAPLGEFGRDIMTRAPEVMIGALALLAGQSGFTGNKHLLEADEYRRYLDDLGQNHEVMALYFKPYPCCRWGHPAIDACLALMAEQHVTAQDITSVTIETFYKATQLSKGIPSCADAAQYNIAYPVAAAIVNNGFSIQQVENTNDDAVIDMMGRLSFVCDPELDAQFPARRLCRAAMVLKDGRRIVSDVHEPRGEACENIGYDWLADKFHRITAHRLTSPQQEVFIQRLHNDDWTVRQLISQVNAALL